MTLCVIQIFKYLMDIFSASLLAEDAALRSLRICTLNQQPVRAEPQTVYFDH